MYRVNHASGSSETRFGRPGSLSEVGDQPVNGIHILNVDKGWYAPDA